MAYLAYTSYISPFIVGRDSSVDIATLRAGRFADRIPMGARFSLGSSGRCVTLTIHLHLGAEVKERVKLYSGVALTVHLHLGAEVKERVKLYSDVTSTIHLHL